MNVRATVGYGWMDSVTLGWVAIPPIVITTDTAVPVVLAVGTVTLSCSKPRIDPGSGPA